jgi:hypothetical protein
VRARWDAPAEVGEPEAERAMLAVDEPAAEAFEPAPEALGPWGPER